MAKRIRDTTAQKAAQHEKREARRAAGLCVYCGAPVVVPPPPERRGRGRPPTGYACAACKEKRR